MTERDPEMWMANQYAGGDQTCSGQRNLTGKSHNLLEHRWAKQALLATRAESVNEHGHTECGGNFEERLEARVSDVQFVEVSADLHRQQGPQFGCAAEVR